jgi:hypothetical protein
LNSKAWLSAVTIIVMAYSCYKMVPSQVGIFGDRG